MPKFYSEDLCESDASVWFYWTQIKSIYDFPYCSYNIGFWLKIFWLKINKKTRSTKIWKYGQGFSYSESSHWLKPLLIICHFQQAKDLIPLFKSHFAYEVSYSVLISRLHKMGWTISVQSDQVQRITFTVFNRTCDHKLFTSWLEYLLKDISSRNCLLILNNASIHKRKEV